MWCKPLIRAFSPADVRAWARALGIETFEGSSGRVFPMGMKAAPLLRSWLHQLRSAGVRFHVRHRWLGWNEDGSLRFATPAGERRVSACQVVLALGGASWPQLGSDGEWVSRLAEKGVAVAPLQPANCGFDAPWSDFFRTRFAGEPVKSVVATFTETGGGSWSRQGDLMITATGVEGGLIYALSRRMRETLNAGREAVLYLDLTPGRSVGRLTEELARPRGSRSLSSHLKRHTGMDGVKAGLLRERLLPQTFAQPAQLARAIKSLPLPLLAPRPVAEAISTAGGVRFEDLDGHLMIRALPGVFCAGEMLHWEAPTGGYLLNACLASGRAAGLGVLACRGELLGPPRAATADRA